jgi:hypothetical protein
MADKKSDVASPLEAPSPPVTHAQTPPAFEADAFLASNDAKTSPKVETKPAVEPARSNSGATIVKRGGVGFFTALLMSTIAAGGGAYLALFAQSRPDLIDKFGARAFIPTPAQVPSTGQGVTNLAPLTLRVSALESELLSLQSKLGVSPPVVLPPNGDGAAPSTNAPAPNAGLPLPLPNTADIGVMKGELSGISGRVTAIETRLAALDPTGAGGAIVAGLQADIASLKSIIANLQQQAATAPSPAVTFALINIAEAANRSGSFMVEYETLRAAMPGVSEVVALEPFARSGVPTRQVLEERFASLAPAVAASVASEKKEIGLVAWVRSLFSDMIKVQPAPDAQSSTPNGAIERAKIKLDQGDYGGSIEALSAIVGPPPIVTDWITQAKRRLELESRISAVRGAAARVPASPVAPQSPLISGQLPSINLPTPTPTVPAPVVPAPAAKIQGQNP